jgi:hypothetical protein
MEVVVLEGSATAPMSSRDVHRMEPSRARLPWLLEKEDTTFSPCYAHEVSVTHRSSRLSHFLFMISLF